MKHINELDVYYLRGDRTVELLLITDLNGTTIKQSVLYVYNYECIHYRVFESAGALLNFFHGMHHSMLADFETEEELYNYLDSEYELK